MSSFSAKTKSELSRVIGVTKEEKMAELSAIMRLAGTLQLKGFKKFNFIISTENPAIARKVFQLLKDCFQVTTQITVQKNGNFKKNNSYNLKITSEMGAFEILQKVGILKESKEGLYINNKVLKNFLKTQEAKRAYVRGAFLGSGSISDPEKTYHMEFVSNSEEYGHNLMEFINEFGLNSKVVTRKNYYVIYLKESENISDVLNIMGAHKALLELENIRVVKEMRNNVNRIVNCETANLSKTVNASIKQIENIKFIISCIGLEGLPENLKEIAILRLENENVSLKELGQMLTNPIGKSGVNHRLRRLEKMANELREKGGNSND